jgi:RNA polymerase sigma factor (sigma-70 family)
MSTSAEQVMSVLVRYFEVAADTGEDARHVEAAARRASADPEFYAALAQVLEADRTCPQRGSMSAYTCLKNYGDAGIDMIIGLPDSTDCCAEQVYALQVKVTEVAGPDLRVRIHLARLLAAAIHLERSSFGTKEARRLRSQPSTDDIVAFRDAWAQLTAVDVAPTLPMHESSQERGADRDLAIDPLRARTAAELVDTLRELRRRAGEPSFREIASHARPHVAPSTIATALNGTRLPTLRVVTALVTGCGGGKEDLDAFTTAWRRVHSAGRLSGQRSREPVDEPGGLNTPIRVEEPTSRDHISSSPSIPVPQEPAREAETRSRAPEGFEEFFRASFRDLVRTAMYAGATLQEAEDATSKTLMEMLQRWTTTEPSLAYARKAVIHNFVKDKTRGPGRIARRLIERGHVLHQEGTEDSQLTAWEGDEWVAHVLSSLPPAQREVMELIVKGLDRDEMAEALGKTKEVIRRNLCDARASLARELHPDQRHPQPPITKASPMEEEEEPLEQLFGEVIALVDTTLGQRDLDLHLEVILAG